MGHCDWGWNFLWGAVGVVARVAEHGHGAGGQVDDVGLAEGVFLVAQVENISLGEAWSRRKRKRRRGRCGIWNWDSFHRRWRRNFTLLVCCWVTHDHWHSQFVLEMGSVGSVGVFQVSHLLVEHPQLVDLIELRGKKTNEEKTHSFEEVKRPLININQGGTYR